MASSIISISSWNIFCWFWGSQTNSSHPVWQMAMNWTSFVIWTTSFREFSARTIPQLRSVSRHSTSPCIYQRSCWESRFQRLIFTEHWHTYWIQHVRELTWYRCFFRAASCRGVAMKISFLEICPSLLMLLVWRTGPTHHVIERFIAEW